MAKELPYFRFVVQEWQNGDISLESYELKGLFIDICGFYWLKDCSLSLAMLEKRFSNARNLLEQLINTDIIKLKSEGNICIEFLDEQFDLLSEKRQKRQLAGQKGGLSKSSNAKAMLKQNSSYKDNNKDKDNNIPNDGGKEDGNDRIGLITLDEEKKIEEVKEVFASVLKSRTWMETTCMNRKRDEFEVTKHFHSFYYHFISIDGHKKEKFDESSIKKHFNNWINKGNPIPQIPEHQRRKKQINME